MKIAGLIGGMSWESTVEYYRIINEQIKNELGNLHSAECIIYSVDFEEIEKCQREGDWKKAARILIDCARKLERAGADFLIICTNTMHKVFREIEENVTIPLLHIADATAEEIKKYNIRTVGLLGTRYTMEQDFYKSRLKEHGIEVVIPKKEDREIINDVIFRELCLGRINNKSKEEYKRIIAELITKGVEGIVLGCTEIPLLIKENDVNVPLFDTTNIHGLKAVKYILQR